MADHGYKDVTECISARELRQKFCYPRMGEVEREGPVAPEVTVTPAIINQTAFRGSGKLP